MIDLLYNASLLLALALLFDISAFRWNMKQINWMQIPLGLVVGGIGIMLMMTPWVLTPGVIFDTRSILLGISGFFFGLIPTVIAMLMTAVFRISQGGAATWMGVSVILTTGIMGLIWRHTLKKRISEVSFFELYIFGVIIHVVMLICALVLPWEVASNILRNISLPVMLIYPIGTAMLGSLMRNRLRKEHINEELLENEERLRLAVQSGFIGLFERNLITGETVTSPEWKSQLGYSETELKNEQQEWLSRLHPEDREAVLAKNEECISGKIPYYESEYRLRHKDGSYHWILARGFLHRDSNGKPEKLIGTHVDVTDQKNFNETLLLSESRFRGLAESSQDYIMLYDRECRHVYMNSAGLKISGFSEKDIFGKTHREAGFSPELYEQWEKDIHCVFETGETTQHLFNWDSKEGTVYLDLRLSPVYGADGKIDLVLGISRDITGIKLAEEALKKTSEQYRMLTENIKDVVWVMDAEEMKFTYISPSVERLRGYTAEEVMSQPVTAALMEEGVIKLSKLIQDRIEALKSGKVSPDTFYTEEVEQPCKDGSTVWTEAVTNFYINPETGHVEVRGVSRDITERRRTEEIMSNAQYELHRMLREADQSRRALLSVAEDQKLAEDALRKTARDLVVAYDATLQGWSTALEMRERETAGHSMRVVKHTLALAETLGIDKEEMVHVQRGALLHDIGKMGIPDSILLKPGPLTDDEWVVMRQHPTYAYKLLSEIPYLLPALEIPYFHHERWDGSGYPNGLKGKDIPLTARIFAVIDVWDALSSDRPYRPAWSEDAVIKYLKDQSSKQFDPDVVDAFLKIIE